MRLPKSISPNPLFITTIEIRFLSSLTKAELLQKMVLAFSDEFTNLEQSKIPEELKQQEKKFKYAADYMLSNDDYILSFATNSISFEHSSEYKYWETYSTFIKKSLEKIFKLGFIEKIERCGVRYGSILDGLTDPSIALIDLPKLEINGLQSEFGGFQSVFKTDTSNLFLQITPNAKISKQHEERRGLYIDIDSSYSKELEPNQEVFDIIDKLHKDQKELFFGLLKEEFVVKNLNPQY
ncbi:TIGR04255 family protein [Flavobacterium sp.]|uniref:TIGR04255 family protein n=1 Tax=Flavobacterium sp. TaxID=239 RepID=UPI002FDE334B